MARLHRGYRRGCLSPCLARLFFLPLVAAFFETGSKSVVTRSEPSEHERTGGVVGQSVTCTSSVYGPFHVVLEPFEGRNSFSIACADGGVLVPSADVFTHSFCSVLTSLQACFSEGPDYRGPEFFDDFSSSWWEGDPTKPHEGMTFTIPLSVFPAETKTIKLGCLYIRTKNICRVVVSARKKLVPVTGVVQTKSSGTVARTGSSATFLKSVVLAIMAAVL
uniref:SAG-related sequence SRS50 n=1 Tax=Toxoplasma gondii COUG TaxID=1074873 RepID=A0A2G8XTG4_TOXGO|nr:SAG-related sequence SRS50 [Toxoplasma gondii COUG]